jgi:16S rRNA (cytidine1402-2'-O)-methyltransferase
MLYIVATPIGNLGDMTLRSLETLKEVEVIAAEDTRRTGKLLSHFGISTKLVSYHDMNKEKRTPQIIALLKEDKEVALVSDAGTPGISDPGFYLVREAVLQGIKVSPLPGANAALSALVCSGLPTDRFTFLGFLPKKNKRCEEMLKDIRRRDETVVVYESPHRLKKSLKRMEGIIPGKHICLARELTKLHEEFLHGTAGELLREIGVKSLRGEIVLVIH